MATRPGSGEAAPFVPSVHPPAGGGDYGRIARELIRALRGERSQRDVSRLLGYSFNQVGKWESGTKHLKWPDFVRLAQGLGVPLDQNLRHYFFTFYTDLDGERDIADVAPLLAHLAGLARAAEARWKTRLRRWLAGKSAPDLPAFLEILDAQPSMLMGWILSLTDVAKIPSLSDLYDDFLIRLELIQKNPRAVYVYSALLLDAYKKLERHDEELVADHASCTVQELRETLAEMQKLYVIRFDGQKYHPCPFDFSFSNLRRPDLRRFTQFTTRLAADKYPLESGEVDWSRIKNPARSSVRVTALSAAAAKQVDLLIERFHAEVGEIVRRDAQPKDHVQVVLLHSFPANITKTPRLIH